MVHASITLDPVVRSISDDFVETERGLELRDNRLAHWRRRLSETPVGRRELLGMQIIALGLKIHQLAGVLGRVVLLQLAELAVMLLGGASRVVDAFARDGVDLREAARRLGMR